LCALSSHVSASTPFYTLSLHDALPISVAALERSRIARESAVTGAHGDRSARCLAIVGAREDRNPEPPGELLHLDAFEEIHRPERRVDGRGVVADGDPRDAVELVFHRTRTTTEEVGHLGATEPAAAPEIRGRVRSEQVAHGARHR